MKTAFSRSAALLVIALLTGAAGIQGAVAEGAPQGQGGQGQGQGGQPRHKPPKEAFDACSGKSQGTSCAFTGREGKQISGVCRQPPRGEDSALVCVPANMPPPGGQGGGQGQGPGGGGQQRQ